MCRRSSSNLSRWLLAAAVLIAIRMGGISPSIAAAACTGNTAEPCAQQSATGWKPVLVEWRERKARLESIRFAERVKRHLGRQFAMRKAQFARHQVRLQRQLRAHKRHAKARQFAAARRHVAQHTHRLRHAAARGHLRRFAAKSRRTARSVAAMPVMSCTGVRFGGMMLTMMSSTSRRRIDGGDPE